MHKFTLKYWIPTLIYIRKYKFIRNIKFNNIISKEFTSKAKLQNLFIIENYTKK